MTFRLLLVALFGFGAGYLLLVAQIELDPWSASDRINSRTLPQIYGVLLCLTVLGLAIGRRNHQVATSGISQRGRTRLLGLSALICIFIVSLLWFNLWVALAGLLFGALWVMGERRWSVIWALCLGIPLVGFVLIEHVLLMTIPLS